jgi:protein-arginine kinase activator protein McsA
MSRMDFEDVFGENSHDYFDSIIRKFGLTSSYVVYQNEKDEVIVDEQWISPKTNSVKANRIFKFDPYFLDLINEKDRVSVMEKALELYVSIENYEEAAIVRDILNIY